MKLLTILLPLVLPGLALAGPKPSEPPSGSLTLASATAEALQHNPTVQAAWRKWNAAQARIRQEAAWEDPKISYDTTAARFVEMAPNTMADQTLALEQMIPVSGKNLSRGRVAAAEALAAYEDFRRRQLDVVSKLRTTYFQYLNLQARLELNRQNATSLDQAATVARARYQSGVETAPEALAAEIERTRLDEERRDLARLQSESRTRLNVLMNRPVSSPIAQLAAAAPPPPSAAEKDLAATMLRTRPEIRFAQARLEAEKARLQFAKREWIPDPAINLNAQRYNDSAQGVSQLGTGISFNIPWVNPGKYSEGVRQANESIAAAEAELQAAKSESLGLLHDQLVRIDTAHHHYELFSGQILPQARQALEAVQLNYETGKASFSDWITAQRSLRDVQATVSEMLTDYQASLAELDAIVGAGAPSTSREIPHHQK